MRGRVKWFSNKLGYGFIESKNIEKDIFVHFSEIQMDGYKYLMENDIVEFEFDENNNKALNIKIIKTGSQYQNLKLIKKLNTVGGDNEIKG